MLDKIMEKSKRNPVFVIFCVIIILYHVLIQLNFGDGVTYFNTILGNIRIVDFWKIRYMGWSSRILIETVLIFITKVPILWRLMDCMIWIGSLYLICNLLELKNKGEQSFLCLLFLLYPFFYMGEAGWMATTVNYLWPFFCFLIVWKGVNVYSAEKHMNIWQYGALFFCLMFASNHEQSAVLVFVMVLYSIVCDWVKKKRIPYFLIVEFVLCVVSLVFILTAPGNQVRKSAEIASHFSEYTQLHFIEKVYLGLLKLEKNFIAVPNSVFILFCIVIWYIIWKGYRTKRNLVISVIPLFIIAGHTILCDFYPNYSRIFFVPEDIYYVEWFSYKTYLPLVYLILVMISLVFSLVQILKHNIEKMMFCIFMLGAGASTVVAMGFSPSMYESGSRTLFYLSFVFIIVLCCVVHEKKDVLCLGKREKEIMIPVFILWAAANVVNIFSCIAYTIFIQIV